MKIRITENQFRLLNNEGNTLNGGNIMGTIGMDSLKQEELYDDNGLAYTGQEKEFPPARTRSNPTQDVNERLKKTLNESFPPNWNLNGCPSPNAQGPFPPNYSAQNWWQGGFGSTFTTHQNQCNFLNNKFNAFMAQIDQNMSSGPPSCSPKYSNMLYQKMSILRELSLRIDSMAASGVVGQSPCNHSWT